MKSRKLAFLPREITTQIILLVVLSAVVFHLCIAMALVLGHHRFAPHRDRFEWDNPGGAFLVHMTDFLRLVEGLPSSEQQKTIAWLNQTFPFLDVRTDSRSASSAPQAVAADTQTFVAELQRHAGPHIKVGSAAADGRDAEASRIVFVLDNGLSVSMATPLPMPPKGLPPNLDISGAPPPPPDIDHPFGRHNGPPLIPHGRNAIELLFATIFFLAISFTIFLVWAIRSLTRPLRKFAEAVESFSTEGTPAPLEEKGPTELRIAAQALNRMRERVKTMIAQRTEMLAAISHDLRTPITRLRLRAEYVEPVEIKEQILRDLDNINAMIYSALSFIRDGIEAQRNILLDLGAILQTICDEFTDMGHRVLFEPPGPTFIKGNAEELYRAITNLVSNGVKFGTEVEIQLHRRNETHVQIDIIDNGPGIPAATKAALFSPFSSSANAHKHDDLNGFGLGLPICQSIVTAHKGTIELLERSPHGAIARVTLSI